MQSSRHILHIDAAGASDSTHGHGLAVAGSERGPGRLDPGDSCGYCWTKALHCIHSVYTESIPHRSASKKDDIGDLCPELWTPAVKFLGHLLGGILYTAYKHLSSNMSWPQIMCRKLQQHATNIYHPKAGNPKIAKPGYRSGLLGLNPFMSTQNIMAKKRA